MAKILDTLMKVKDKRDEIRDKTPVWREANKLQNKVTDKVGGTLIKGGKKIMNAVEWHEESKIKIPDWCSLKRSEDREKKIDSIIGD